MYTWNWHDMKWTPGITWHQMTSNGHLKWTKHEMYTSNWHNMKSTPEIDMTWFGHLKKNKWMDLYWTIWEATLTLFMSLKNQHTGKSCSVAVSMQDFRMWDLSSSLHRSFGNLLSYAFKNYFSLSIVTDWFFFLFTWIQSLNFTFSLIPHFNKSHTEYLILHLSENTEIIYK